MDFAEFEKLVKDRVNKMKYNYSTDKDVDSAINEHSDLISDAFNDDPTENGADYVAREIVAYFM